MSPHSSSIIPVESINPQDYGLVRGENVLNHAIELAGK